MNDQQLTDALRAIGRRPAAPDPAFAEDLWEHISRGHGTRRRVDSRRQLMLVAVALMLLAIGFAIAAGAGWFQDRDPLRIAMATAEPTLDVPALVGPWRVTPIPVPDGLLAEIEIACREDWLAGDQRFGREHRGAEYIVALLDARGEGRATMVFRGSDWNVNFCDARFTPDGELDSVDMATFGGPGASLRPMAMSFGPAWSTGSGDPGNPVTEYGPVGSAGLDIHTAIMESEGRPAVNLSVGNGAWAFWVPWDWEAVPSVITGFDANGLPVFYLPRT